MLQECHKRYWESDRADLIESVKKLLRRKKKESEQRHDIAIYIHIAIIKSEYLPLVV